MANTKVNTTPNKPNDNAIEKSQSASELELLKKEMKELKEMYRVNAVNSTVGKKDSSLKSPLLNKKVRIEMVPNINNTFHKDPNQNTLLTGSASSFKVPVDNKTGYLVDPLTREERVFLENELGISLNIYERNTETDPKANFWSTKKATVVLRKDGNTLSSASITLDLSNPYDFIKYKIALISPRVANSWAEKHDLGEYEFMIVDGDVETEESLKMVQMKDIVLEYLFSIKTNKKKLFDLIRLYGEKTLFKAITYQNSSEKMYLELRKLVDSSVAVRDLYALIIQGDKIANKVFIQDAITCGIILRVGAEYTLKGGAIIGYDMDSTIAFVLKPENQSTKMQIQAAIEDYYNTNQ